LGNAALVDSLSQALSAWRSTGRAQCLVTLEGDMVDRSGILTGGKAGSELQRNPGRKREMKELEANLWSLAGKKMKRSEGNWKSAFARR